MTAPDRIYLDQDADADDGMFPRCFGNPKYCSEPAIEYVRADLGAAMIRDAVDADREACAKFVDRLHTQSASIIAAAIRARKGGE